MMTQAECLKILKKNPEKWFTTRDICKILDKTISNVGDNLRKLHKQGVVFRSTIKTEWGARKFIYKIR